MSFDDEDDGNDVENATQALDEIQERIQDVRKKCQFNTSLRLAREYKVMAKLERQVVHYLIANFFIMNSAQNTLEPQVGVEAAIDNIALLESEEQARQFQPDFPQHEYDHTVQWMSSCSYDNLGTHVAYRSGYNSEGVFETIEDGMQVCRRTGKLECIACFRQYASAVFLNSGDLEMALHHSRTVRNTPPREFNDRRWIGARDTTRILTLRGDLAVARESALEALRLAPSYHTPLDSYLTSRLALEEILLLQGKGEELESLCREAGPVFELSEFPAVGEHVSYDLSVAENLATRLCCEGRYDQAIDVLTEWDQRLNSLNCLTEWFEVRLRLVSVCALAGRTTQLNALARQLETRAKTARNWLTIHRLQKLLDGSVPASPVPLLEPASEGQFAAGDRASTAPVATAAAAPAGATPAANAPPADEALSPLRTLIHGAIDRISDSEGSEQVLAAVCEELLSIPLDEITPDIDAAFLLFILAKLLRDENQARRGWALALELVARYPSHGGVRNVAASLGHAGRTCFNVEDADALVTLARIEAMFRESFDLDSEQPQGHARMAWFYLAQGKTAEAERYLARSFQLDRGNSDTVLALAEIYQETDRSVDALAVLDLAIREGCDDPRVAWHAGMLASELQKHESALAYLDRHECVLADSRWTQYFRASSLVNLDRPQEALAAIDAEQARWDCPLPHLEIIGAIASAQLAELDKFRDKLAKVVAKGLKACDKLSQQDLAQALNKLYEESACLPADSPERKAFEAMLLQSGLAPGELFAAAASTGEEEEFIDFFVCLIRQPLDDRWRRSAGCLSGQEEWTEYFATWGVLALDEDQAGELALEWQARCSPLPAELVECELLASDSDERPRVVWQGIHRAQLENQ